MTTLDEFVYLAQRMEVVSSNLAAALYQFDQRQLLVWFTNGYCYAVEPISESEAITFYGASSKGRWYWDNIRVRGTSHNAQKSVTRVFA